MSKEKLTDLSVTEFSRLTASDAPAPGGGSVSALCGALAASLASMVVNLTVGKKISEEDRDELTKILAEAESIRTDLLKAVDDDSESFNEFMAALKLPKATEEEKKYRAQKMQEGLKKATDVPLKTAQTALRIFDLAETLQDLGNQNALSDALVAALLAEAAVRGAALNVRINLGSIKDAEFTASLKNEVVRLEEEASARQNRIMRKGLEKLS